VAAHLRVHGDVAAARRFLEPLDDHLRTGCLGTISEIFDGGAPFAPRGCVAQAWSVAEALRAFDLLDRAAAGQSSGSIAKTRTGARRRAK
jgi:glycogen debranching enzyme